MARRRLPDDVSIGKPSIPQKVASLERDPALDLSEVRGLLRSAALVTIGVLACALAIGACRGAWRGELDSFRDSLMIAGCLLLISWMMTLFIVAAVSIPEIIFWSYRRVVLWSYRKPNVGGGVADEWLDGPT
jgi:hypothetical protein